MTSRSLILNEDRVSGIGWNWFRGRNRMTAGRSYNFSNYKLRNYNFDKWLNFGTIYIYIYIYMGVASQWAATGIFVHISSIYLHRNVIFLPVVVHI